MSNVTGIVVMASLAEPDHEGDDGKVVVHWISDANKWIDKNWYLPGGGLIQLDDSMSCGKHPQFTVAGGGYNGFPEKAFVEWLRSYEWEDPSQVVIVINPEHDPLYVVRPYKATI